MKCLTWSEFKTTCITKKNLNLQYEDLGPQYRIIGPEGNLTWEIVLNKTLDDGSANPDVSDFETNYKASANMPLEVRAGIGRPVRVSASPQPANTTEHWKGFQLIIPAGQTSAYVDISFASVVYLRGGNIVSPDVDFDDYINVDVLVTANSAMYLSGLISNAYMIPNLPVSFTSQESMAFPPSLKVRVTVNIGVSQNTDVHANILVDYFV